MVQDKRLMKLRKKINKSRPSFRRVESWRYKRVKDPWRKARGIDSKTRKKKKSGVKSPSVGYRGPKKVRGLHPSGYEEVRVTTVSDIKNLNNRKHALKISGKLGTKKRIVLVDYCQKKGFKILGDRVFKTWSCYENYKLHCGKCESCNNRKKAFVEAGIVDKTKYMDS